MNDWRIALAWEVEPEGPADMPLPDPIDEDPDVRETIIYLDGGSIYVGHGHFRDEFFGRVHEYALATGHVGHLEGYMVRNMLGPGEERSPLVICYFKQKPDRQEILRRRSNGFQNARWRPI